MCDVFIPLHVKDLHVLELCIKSLRAFLSPAPERIVVVTQGLTDKQRQMLEGLRLEILNENCIGTLPPKSTLPEVWFNATDRSGWYYQQFLKWEVRKLSQTPYYLIIDADTILLKRTPLMDDRGRWIFGQSRHYHPPYFHTFHRLFGWTPERHPSFIVNHMVFEVAYLEQMCAEIEATHFGKSWWSVILENIERSEVSSFSEFETYGSWLAHHYPDKVARVSALNLNSNFKWIWLKPIHKLIAKVLGYYSVTYHRHL